MEKYTSMLARLNFVLAWVKYVPNFSLFCHKSEFCCNFVFLFMAFSFVNVYFYIKKRNKYNY